MLAPGGPSTYHIVNEAFLKKMKKSSILVNVARGSLVDSDALAKALRENWIWGAGIDVVEGEPNITREHPLIKEPRYVFFLPRILKPVELLMSGVLCYLTSEVPPSRLGLRWHA